MKEIEVIEINHLLSDLCKRMCCSFKDKAIRFGSETKHRREKLTSLHISMENRKGVCKVNGEDVSSTTSHLELVFDNGEWSLMISEDTLYTTNDQKVTE